MDTVPGGESDQYESMKTEISEPPAKETGQLGGDTGSEQTDMDQKKAEQGEKHAESVRYGQNISESGMGGMTTGTSGEANQSGFGGTEEQSGQDTTMPERREQGYGPGSGVGA